MLPTSFQTLRTLKVLNIGAVALALAGIVGVVLAIGGFSATSYSTDSAGSAIGGAIGAAPTLLCGLLWAWLLRRPATVGNSSIRWGWVASIPLAMANGGLTVAALMALPITTRANLGTLLGAAFLGATVGAIVWIPALLATLVCFGLPIAWAQHLAKKGLAGEERGEKIVGLGCVLMSLGGLVLSYALAPHLGRGAAEGLVAPRVIALLGLVAGLASTTLARAREARRRTFVTDAAAGKIVGYRIDATDEGKVLVRVVSQGNGYRVADFEEKVFELDAEGEATLDLGQMHGGIEAASPANHGIDVITRGVAPCTSACGEDRPCGDPARSMSVPD